MPTFVCDFCGKKFEAPKQKRFCSTEHRSQAFANFYMAVPPSTGYDGIVSVRAPKLGWVRNTEHTSLTNDKGFEIKLKVGSDGHVRALAVRTLPHMQIPEALYKKEKKRQNKNSLM